MTDRPDVGGPGALAEAFEAERGYLRAVAYRILGSVTDTEDIVQDAWLRLARTDPAAIEDLRGWLTVVVGRLCLDHLRSARVRRETYVGPWLPEPLVDPSGPGGSGGSAVAGVAAHTGRGRPGPAGGGGATGPAGEVTAVAAERADPADRVTLAESVSMAMLVVLESLSPAERTALILHDVFGFGFEEVAEVTGRSPAASRQLASRARRHVRERAVRFDPDPAQRRGVADAFLAAAAGGDLAALLRVLDPDVVLRSDGGGVVRAALRPIDGADKVARFLHGLIEKGRRQYGTAVRFVPVEVNGGAGIATYAGPRLVNVVALTVWRGLVTEIDVVVNPAKLRHLTQPPHGG
ncbi:sigma-70 family RNA polymerase sigma factor [Parafrankia sp. BMG5.11]|uniref:sigma-70 family RNA polymerase sigma factor n=1 Tax=Parafrankia sp. BMG5.11 TaxID=222540 RepID=UPI00103AEF4A|nr:sigma-70 family RNA polymerase sigma factor [Parafrankia sp. BMG5.11]TCJ36147.1 sigma-70 family RNA polymerase sigma factor [Parafrankia sp. BMG5.11]